VTTTTARKRTKTAVRAYAEGGFLVRGTLDPMTALRLAVAELDDYQLGGGVYDGCRPLYDGEKAPSREDAVWCGDALHTLLSTARPGRYRIVPAPRDDDFDLYVRRADHRGRGAFDAVEFQC
jgi:hypothetical protein